MGELQGLAVLVMLLGIFSTIFWMVVSCARDESTRKTRRFC